MPVIELKEGQKIPIYKGVISETRKEADVTLVKKILTTKNRELWSVIMPNGMQMRKWIKKVPAI